MGLKKTEISQNMMVFPMKEIPDLEKRLMFLWVPVLQISIQTL